MSDERELERLCQAALERPPAERAAFLAEACGGDDGLRREVESLLARDGAAASFLEMPALAIAARTMSTDTPALTVGQQIGPYTIVSRLGSGGMGEVYRARDATLHREVAIKVLPMLFTSDPDRLGRFEREARVLASLNHPNIATIHGVEHVDGIHALILEVVEGETLAERLHSVGSGLPGRRSRNGDGGRRTPSGLPLSDAMTIARQIAEALEAAHEKGIVHRDLKPANIKIRPDGVVKLLDFGLAKAVADAAPRSDLSQAPTLMVGPTREGMLLGTVAYMSPEQARGQPVKTRTDIWAFGCLLYEMLVGRPAFAGGTVSDTIAAILEHEPDWTALPATTPPPVRRLLARCLDKDPKRRLHDIADARIEIEDVLSGTSIDPAATPVVAQPRSSVRLRSIAAIASLVAVIAVGALMWYLRTASQVQSAPPRISRMTIASSGPAAVTTNNARSLAITPDGTRVVYIGNQGTQLFVRPLDRLDPVAIATGVVPLNWVFVSPDGQWVGFQEGETLKKVAITGGPAEALGPGGGGGATWAPDDTIIFANADRTTGLQRVSAAGGEVAVLTRPPRDRGELNHLWPEMLPGGRAVLFTITATTGGLDAAQVAVLDLATRTPTVLVRGGSHAHYVPSGHIVFTAGGALRAVPFDPARLALRGSAVTVLPRVLTSPAGGSDFDVAADGTLAYVEGPVGSLTAARTLVWVDRQGREEPLAARQRPYLHPRLSPDGTRVAVHISEPPGGHIWVWDLARETPSQLTFGPGPSFFPVWTTNGRHLFFSGAAGLAWQPADGSGAAEQLGTGVPSGMTPDGKQVLFSPMGRDVMVLTLDGTRGAEPLIQTPANERNAVVSPNGRWLAYESDKEERFEIFVVPFPNVSAGTWRISTAGGTRPLWAPNGQELFWVAPDGAIMAVRVDAGSGTCCAGSPAKVLEGRYVTGSPISGRNYDVSTDGKRFLVVKAAAQAAAPSIIVVQNWPEELKRLAPATP